MTFQLEKETDRSGTHSLKWEFLHIDDQIIHKDDWALANGKEPPLPMWVADMDFRSPPQVIEAMVARAGQGIYGYAYPTDSYYEAVVNWVSRRHGWALNPEWVELAPGIVPALNMLVETVIKPGDKVLVQPPVYYPFFDAIESNGGAIVNNPLTYAAGRYTMDYADLAEKAADPAVRMAILCSPHNPVGRVWTRSELQQYAEICAAHDVLVVADEVHGDLIYGENDFTAYATLGDAFLQKSIICVAASKTFNLGGLQTSNIIIPDRELRDAYAATLGRHGLVLPNTFGLIATEAAFNHGEAWLAAVMAYVEDNYRFLQACLAAALPEIKVIRPEGTYLVWVDFGALGFSSTQLNALLLEQAGVLLDDGLIFGEGGVGFQRFNIACPRSVLELVLSRIVTTIKERGLG